MQEQADRSCGVQPSQSCGQSVTVLDLAVEPCCQVDFVSSHSGPWQRREPSLRCSSPRSLGAGCIWTGVRASTSTVCHLITEPDSTSTSLSPGISSLARQLGRSLAGCRRNARQEGVREDPPNAYRSRSPRRHTVDAEDLVEPFRSHSSPGIYVADKKGWSLRKHERAS